MTRIISLGQHGGPNVLKVQDVALRPPAAHELRVRQTAIGVNYHDVYVRSGLYQTLPLPGVPGIEAVGIVEQVGAGAGDFKPGDRVGYVTGQYGAYAEARNLDSALAIRIPPSLTDAQAAASLMKSLTVCMLVRRVARLERGNVILVHAAAGGVGQILCNWASHLGAHVIGTVGDAAKADVARAAGAADIIFYRDENVAARVAEITNANGLDVVYDSIGADTFMDSVAALGFEGHLVNFGQASGPVPPFSLSLLARRSLSISRPIIFHYLRTPEKLRSMTEETFAALAACIIRPIEPRIMRLAEVSQAHQLLEQRQSPGGIVLVP